MNPPFFQQRQCSSCFCFPLLPELGDIPVRDEHSFHGKPAGLLRSHRGRDVPGEGGSAWRTDVACFPDGNRNSSFPHQSPYRGKLGENLAAAAATTAGADAPACVLMLIISDGTGGHRNLRLREIFTRKERGPGREGIKDANLPGRGNAFRGTELARQWMHRAEKRFESDSLLALLELCVINVGEMGLGVSRTGTGERQGLDVKFLPVRQARVFGAERRVGKRRIYRRNFDVYRLVINAREIGNFHD